MILLISGPAGVGKTSITDILQKDHGYGTIKSSKYLREIAAREKLPITRENLIAIGDRLDEETDYLWIVEKVTKPQIFENPSINNWLLDSVRKKQQVVHLRTKTYLEVFHVHVTASEEVIKERYMLRQNHNKDSGYEQSYDDLIQCPNEIASRSLEAIADYVLIYEDILPAQAAQKIMAQQVAL